MKLKKAKLSEIIHAANILREKSTCSVYTNYYNQFDLNGDELFDVYTANGIVCFGIEDNGIYRIFFYCIDLSLLDSVLLLFPKAILEYIYVGEKCDIDFTSLKNLRQIDSFKRYHTLLKDNEFAKKLDDKFLEKYISDSSMPATISDFEEIKTLLYKIFDPRVSHLPSDEELKSLLITKSVIICKINNEIKTFWIYKKEGKKVYSYQAYNSIQGIYMQSLWYSYFTFFANEQFREVYAWVSDKNFFSLNLHYKFNFTFDRQKLLIFETNK